MKLDPIICDKCGIYYDKEICTINSKKSAGINEYVFKYQCPLCKEIAVEVVDLCEDPNDRCWQDE